MKRIVLNTSSSGLHYLGVRHQVGIIPLMVRFSNELFLDDGKNLTPARLSKFMQKHPKAIANTSPLDETAISEIFSQLYRQKYTDVFVCCLSSKFSKNYELLMYQKGKYRGEMNICVYDTKTLNLGEAALAYEADHLVQAGVSFEDIVHRLDDLRTKQAFSFTLESLDYIINNKKLSGAAGFVANLFDIKPIMQITDDGFIVPKDKVRKFERTVRQMARQIGDLTAGQTRYLYLADGGVDGLTDYCRALIKDELGISSLPAIGVSCVSLANHGPLGIGLGAFYGNLPRLVEVLPEFQE